MFNKVDILEKLMTYRHVHRDAGEEIIHETRRILRNDMFTEKKILGHLRQYNQTFQVVDEEDVDPAMIFTENEIKGIAVKYRLKFLDSGRYKGDIPYEAILKIKEFNRQYRKDLQLFNVLSVESEFTGKTNDAPALLFVKTNNENYCLVHAWGRNLSWWRSIVAWPLRRFENLFVTVMVITAIITLVLPTNLITLDSKATYWCGYRMAAFFHLFIFNLGVTAYITFAFSKNFSDSVWNRVGNFG